MSHTIQQCSTGLKAAVAQQGKWNLQDLLLLQPQAFLYSCLLLCLLQSASAGKQPVSSYATKDKNQVCC